MFVRLVSSTALLLGLSMDGALAVRSTDSYATTELDNSCVGKEDGEYWLQLSVASSDYDPVKVTCSNEFVIIDVSKESGMEAYFSSMTMWHYGLGGPINSDPVTWQEWFIPERDDSDATYALSPDCRSCDADSEIQVFGSASTYWMTGSLAKLFWGITGFNECDFDTDTYKCFNCQQCSNTGACLPSEISDTSIDYTTGGMCGVAVNPAYKAVYTTRQETQTLATTPHYKPSIGTDGRFCVCYQPAEADLDTYQLTAEQSGIVDDDGEKKIWHANEVLVSAYTRGLRVDGHSPFTVSEDSEEDEDGAVAAEAGSLHYVDMNSLMPDEIQDQRANNKVYLSQKDFYDGTYRISESGTYILTEDIEIDFNSNDNYWPRSDQKDEYPGADDYRDAYNMGFFAGITVEANYVTIDLNNFELKQSMEFYYNQRWFALIELSNQQFLPGQGPSFFGAFTINVKEISILNGVLGRTSHFAIHGNHPSNVLIDNVQIRDFETHGMQLNGWNGLIMRNVEIGPNSVVAHLRGEYGHGRLISRRLRAIEELKEADGTSDETVSFHGRAPQSISDLADELEIQMEMALEYALNRGKYGGRYADSDYINPEWLSTDEGRARWHKAKELFTHASGYPSASSVTGMFLNFDGANVNTYAKYTMPDHQSNNAYLENIYIHDLTHDFEESMKLAGHGYLYTTPWLTDIPAEGTMGNKERLMEFYTALHSMDDSDDDVPDLKEFTYIGNALTDSYIAMWTLNDDWDILGFLAMVMKDDTANLADWAFGETTANTNWRLDCNQDSMSHSGKGLLGLRIDGSNDVTLKDIKLENFYQYSKLGSLVCGAYTWVSEDGEGGHFRQRTPQQTGFSGNNLQALSLSSSTDIKIEGNILINNINTDYSEGYGISLWTANDITVDKDALISITGMNMGKKLEEGLLTYDSLPNRSPEACAFRLEISDESDLFETTVIFEHEGDVDDTGIMNVVTCNVGGHTTCMGDSEQGTTMYGNDFGTSAVCGSIQERAHIDRYSDQARKPLSKNKNSHVNSVNVASGSSVFGSLANLTMVAVFLLVASLIGIFVLLATYYKYITGDSKHVAIGSPSPSEHEHETLALEDQQWARSDLVRYGAI